MASIKDIAEAVGVSPSTVSRVINGKSYVNEATRQKVQDMLARTGYQSNALAKSLKLRRSNTICLMLPSIDNLIFPAITRGWRRWPASTASWWCCATPTRTARRRTYTSRR